MAEKRPYAGDHESPGGAKRPKPINALDAVAAAKAKAEAKAAEIKARLAAAANGASSAPAPAPPAASSVPPPGGAADRLAAMKARLAALKNSTHTPTDAPVRPSLTPSDTRSRPNEDRGPRFATTLGNRSAASPMPAPKAHKPAPKQEEEEERENPYFDPKVAGTGQRLGRALLFNQRGKYVEQGSKLRAQSALEAIKKKLALQARKEKLDVASEKGFICSQPPDVEWWDEGLLEEKTYDCIDNPSKVKMDSDDSIITIYVQHPVLLRPPQDALFQQLKPMFLTTKEQAKLRRMRRAAELKENQALVRLGLKEPEKPKVKRGNMMRVMGEQAIADPTAVEQLVESQIKERHDKHVESNEERKLSKEQRNDKLANNQARDAAKGLHMAVFKIDSLASGKHRYQVDINAKEWGLTGILLLSRHFNLVIVEGGLHSIQKYKKALGRVKWTENSVPTNQEKEENNPQFIQSLDEHGVLKPLNFNACRILFEGEVKTRTYRKWGSKVAESDGEAKEFLARSKLDSLWAMAEQTV